MKVVLDATQFATVLNQNPGAVDPFSGLAMSGELPGSFTIKVNIGASDFAALMASYVASGGVIGGFGPNQPPATGGATFAPPYCTLDASGNVTKLLLAASQPVTSPEVLFVVSGAYPFATLAALFPLLTFVQADSIVED